MRTWNRGIVRKGAILFFLISIAGLIPGFAQIASNRYALILDDPPASSQFSSRGAMRSAAAASYVQQIQARQQTLRAALTRANIKTTGSVSTLMNAVFVVAPKARVTEMQGLPGVKAVVPLRRYHLNLNRATQLVNAPAAWNIVGGVQNAGLGIKIAILDSGIDQTHPAFQDPSLPMPPGYPLCEGDDCAYTTNKVIVARSYVRQLAAGTAQDPAVDSRPDDYSARDRDGHGTAVASCAAGLSSSGVVTISGMAPKAYLGNYKIYGSPEVNDSTYDDVIILALEDALNDGMDIVSFSTGGPSFSGPLDTGSACGNAPGVPCDILAQAFENAAKEGMIIVVAAGNDGDSGFYYPAFNTISSPADAPSVIAAGATTNSHYFLETVSVSGAGAPAGLGSIASDSGDAYLPFGATTAPLRDVTTLGNDGLACASLPDGSLDGAFALIERGSCNFSDKLANAENAGALGVIFYMADQSPITSPGGLSTFAIPATMISNTDGMALKSFIDANPNYPATIDPNGAEQDYSGYNELAGFSSFGPSAGNAAIKPDLVAVGTYMYMAAEDYDPLGILYSSNRYAAASGTSFATPLISGAAALVKQYHPNFTAEQVKSALVNNASQDVTTDDSTTPIPVDVEWLGAGKLDAGAAVAATLTVSPTSLSFGAIGSGSLPTAVAVNVTNHGTVAAAITAGVVANQSSAATVTLDKQNLTLAPGASGTITATLAGSLPAPGSYSGVMTLAANGVTLRVPYLFLVGDGVPDNMIPLTGTGFDGTVGEVIPQGLFAIKVIDSSGLPVAGAPVTFSARNGGSYQGADSTTDVNGIAAAVPVLGGQPGNYNFNVSAAGGLRLTLSGTARLKPTISPNGIVNAADYDANPVAPGSYISLFGSGLSDTTDYSVAAILPLAIDYVNVSFDVPSAGISVPGHLTYVSPSQVNVQVPWELQNQSAAEVKVTIDYSNGNVFTLPLANYAPAWFEVGSGMVAALDLNYQLIDSANPARPGSVVQLYANGLGPVTNQPKSGEPASGVVLSEMTNPPTVTIGGQTAVVGFRGLAPGFAGLYQVNVTIPENLAPGNYPITISIGGKTSRASNIQVQ